MGHKIKPVIQSLFEKYDNPISSGVIKITCSSSSSNQNPENLLKWNSELGWTSNKEEGQFFIIDFLSNYVSIPRYGMKTFYNDHAPMEWKILGSKDSVNWVEVDTRNENLCEGHMGKRSSSDNFNVCLGINERIFDSKKKGVFRYIKVQQIGKNSASLSPSLSNNEYLYMFYLNAFEVFGEIGRLRYFFNTIAKNESSLHLFLLIMLLRS